VEAGCMASEMDEFEIEAQLLSVQGGGVVVGLDQVMDSYSKMYGNQDGYTFCGGRAFEIVDS
jgi:hypothetical protein